MKAMKAASKTPELDTIAYPVLASPKLDGFRCYIEDGVPKTQGGNPVVNLYVRKQLSDLPDFDGELMLNNGDFESAQSAFTSVHGEPNFTYNIFDIWSSDRPYTSRVDEYGIAVRCFLDKMPELPIAAVPQNRIANKEALAVFWQSMIDEGHEGAMARSLTGPYKHGRSTLREGYLIKLKRWADDEGTIVGMEEELDANKVPKGTMGKLIVVWRGQKIPVAGFTDKMKADVWDNFQKYEGKIVTFKYQNLTRKGLPRFPIYKGVRYD